MTEFLLDVSVEDDKYTVRQSLDGKLYALRHGEEWRDLIGDKLIYCLASEIARLRALLEPQPITLPAPLKEHHCSFCRQRMNVPYAHINSVPGAGWVFEWDCARRCQDDLGILFFLDGEHTQADLERAGFTIIEGEKT